MVVSGNFNPARLAHVAAMAGVIPPRTSKVRSAAEKRPTTRYRHSTGSNVRRFRRAWVCVLLMAALPCSQLSFFWHPGQPKSVITRDAQFYNRVYPEIVQGPSTRMESRKPCAFGVTKWPGSSPPGEGPVRGRHRQFDPAH